MNRAQFSFLIFISFFMGILLFAYQQEWIIIRLPWNQEKTTKLKKTLNKKQEIYVYYLKNQEWKKEKLQIIDSAAKEEQLYHLVNAWLTLVYDEYHAKIKAVTETIALSNGKQQLYLNFNQNLFPLEWSIYQKWTFIEGLLKTMYHFDSSITSVQFLIKHAPMKDSHLDFSRPWPIQGFTGYIS